ncbi:hypothetical protein ACFQ1E_18380 [Sphingomonas canadensis]|uniref:Uncharacterized protein n=1 Tax=Sphingomonas canadensis TaxID=1219257 RepID=A0ABW3HAW5_9SPHN|nr:hypothetical protein [Sphingomonas canadensis]MCW3837891.1 hypothetical protein [Sphingomonas canadensis]
MAALLGMAFFAGVLAISVWSIVATVRPRLGRILFLLEYGPVIGAELPPAPRVRAAMRPVPQARPAYRPELRQAA